MTYNFVITYHFSKPIIGEQCARDAEIVFFRTAVAPSRDVLTFAVLQNVLAAAGSIPFV